MRLRYALETLVSTVIKVILNNGDTDDGEYNADGECFDKSLGPVAN